MPNDCTNHLFVHGSPDDIAGLRAHVLRPDPDGDARAGLAFAALVPEPADLCRDPNPRVMSKAVYDWRVEHWGTKWPAYETRIRTDENDACAIPADLWVSFETAWSPPFPVIDALAARFPRLSVRHVYYEGGHDFGGDRRYEGGTLVEEDEFGYGIGHEMVYGEPDPLLEDEDAEEGCAE